MIIDKALTDIVPTGTGVTRAIFNDEVDCKGGVSDR